MLIFKRTILVGLFLMLSALAAYPESSEKIEPIAQVYEIQGKATVKTPSDGKEMEIRKGSLLGRQDSLTLDKKTSVGLYFKNGGKKEIKANDSQSVYKVADLFPKTEAYGLTVPLFGATRGPDIPERGFGGVSFFYPQETIVLESPFLIEFKVFNSLEQGGALGGATIEIVKNGAVVDSRKFDMLEFGSPCIYQSPRLKGQTEYQVEIKVDLKEILGNVMSISFPLYIAEIPDKSLSLNFTPFIDSFYRSFESTSTEYKGKKHTMSLIKQLVTKGDSRQSVILIELFIA